MRVIVTEYQPAWVEQFEEEAQALETDSKGKLS